MAFSRLRHVARSRSFSFVSVRPITIGSVTRAVDTHDFSVEGIGNAIFFRPSALSLVNRVCRSPFADKLQIGARCFSSNGPHIVLEMPALSPTMNQGNIAKWRKKEGDKIEVGDVICEIETDKATLEFESMEEGYLAKILTPEGSKDVAVGQPIAITVEDSEDIKNVPTTLSSASDSKEEKSTHGDVENRERTPQTSFSRISPSAKLLIAEFGLDTTLLKASGPRGTLLKGDVLAAIKSGMGSSRGSNSSREKKSLSKSTQSPQPTPHASPSGPRSPALTVDAHEDFPNSQIRKVIARRLVESKQSIPHFYLSSDVILDPLLALRKELKDQHDVKVSVNDIVIKAVALALRNVPEVNACWNEEKGEAALCDSVDISVAVATEKGLMTPIVRNADQKSLSAISIEVKELAEKARAGKLAPNEFQGGTFSISNLGMFPVDRFCAIINPPQACILAVGRGNKVVEPVVDSDGTERPTVVTKMNLTLSADNRVFDGDIGGTFTLSNLGMFGVDRFDAILPPGTGAIMAVGASEPNVVATKDGRIGVKNQMQVNVTADHRVIYGADLASFLQTLAKIIEDPKDLTL